MRQCIFLSSLLLTLAVMTGCTDDLGVDFGLQTGINYRGEPVDAFLNITVGELSVNMQTRADGDEEEEEIPDVYDPYEDTEAERYVHDLWIFQYDAEDETLIADPIYLIIEDQHELENLPVTLSNNREGTTSYPSIVYVVTNTGDESWGIDATLNTIDGLMADALPSHEPIFVTASTQVGDIAIPMEGNSGAFQLHENEVVTVPVERMYAKVMIAEPVVDIEVVVDQGQGTVGTEQAKTDIYSVSIGNIPVYCRVGTLWNGLGTTGATYPDNVQWISRAFSDTLSTTKRPDIVQPDAGTSSNTFYPYVAYVPENLAGQAGVDNTSKLDQEDMAPSHALQVNIVISYHDPNDDAITHYPYTVYPGADVFTDYNIRRNCVYRVKVTIDQLSIERVPSANCLVGIEGEVISFFPYYRVETGGGYDYRDYLYPTPGQPDEDGKEWQGSKIESLGIIWQTEDCIGDNSNGDLVYLSTNAETHTGYEQIHVKTKKEGNALIGAYDAEGNIIWSWHIWVRSEDNGDPTHPANALVYYTYDWDNTGIYSYYRQDNPYGNMDGAAARRVAGYEIMACNLGALQDKPNWANCTHLGDTVSIDGATSNGAISREPQVQTFDEGDGIVRTFGMLYQWGRKDPFPPMIKTNGGLGVSRLFGSINTGYYIHDYDDAHTEQHYDNAMKPVHKTAYEQSGPRYSAGDHTNDNNYLFYTHIHNEATDGVGGMRYAIQHPTVFLSGVYDIGHTLLAAYAETGYPNAQRADSTTYVNSMYNYIFAGAWSEDDHDNREWGGLEPDESKKSYELPLKYDDGQTIWLYDDYEDDTGLGSKSIFDPCPYGWRVGSGDMWLGFTRSGINPWYDPWDNTVVGDSLEYGSLNNINFDLSRSCYLGMSMYLGDGWQTGDTSWFPTQGFRMPDGCGYRVGGCGNYVNANTGANDRVNIIHIHCSYLYFKQFETQLFYTVKSSGNPLRCVRDSK